MSSEEKISRLENLLKLLVKDIYDTRKAISEGFQKVDDNFTKIHDKIDTFSGKTKKDFQKVDFNLESIKSEITKINSVTGYEDAVNNLKAIKGGKGE